MTATQMIRQLETVPAKERRKMFAQVDAEIERQEEEADRAAVAASRMDPRPNVRWPTAKKRLGLV
jgi:hypothetical protein